MDCVSAQNVILLLQFLVSVVTLVFLIKYVRATVGIEKAANEQSEGLSKPAVTVYCRVPNPTVEAVLKGISFGEIVGPDLEMVNIGNGPALQLHWSLTWKSQRQNGLGGSQNGFVPFLSPGDKFATTISRNLLGQDNLCSVRCSYRGLSGAEYVSVAGLEGPRVKEVNF